MQGMTIDKPSQIVDPLTQKKSALSDRYTNGPPYSQIGETAIVLNKEDTSQHPSGAVTAGSFGLSFPVILRNAHMRVYFTYT